MPSPSRQTRQRLSKVKHSDLSYASLPGSHHQGVLQRMWLQPGDIQREVWFVLHCEVSAARVVWWLGSSARRCQDSSWCWLHDSSKRWASALMSRDSCHSFFDDIQVMTNKEELCWLWDRRWQIPQCCQWTPCTRPSWCSSPSWWRGTSRLTARAMWFSQIKKEQLWGMLWS